MIELLLCFFLKTALAQPMAPEIQVPLILNGLPAAQLGLVPNEAQPDLSTVSSSDILLILKEVTSESFYALLSQRLSGAERTTVADLQNSGLQVTFKLDLLQLEILILAKDRSLKALDFRESSTPLGPGEDLIQPSSFSGYTNIFSSKTFDSKTPEKVSEDRPLQVRFENVQNLYGTYLESYVNYNEFDLHPWTRDHIRLSHDFESSATRATIGDYDLPFVGFQRSLGMGGFLYRRAFDVNPDLPISTIGKFDFYLDSPSRVDIYVNERFFRKISLPAGRHNLSNLPLEPGLNNIRLQITDETGRVSFLNFPFVSDLDLLDSGTHDFSYAGGVPHTQVDGVLNYGKEEGETGSFYHRYGLGQNVTLGVNAQGDRKQSMYGGEMVLSTPLGLVGLDLATSEIKGVGRAHAYQLRYRSLFSQRTLLRLSILRLDQRFGALGTLAPINPYDYTATGAISSNLVDLFNFSTGLTYRNHRENLGDSATAFLHLNRTFGRQFNLSFQLSQTQDPVASENQETRAFIIASWLDSTDGFQAIVNHDTESRTTRADLTVAPRTSDFSLDAGLSHDSERFDQVSAGIGLDRPRYEARIDQIVTLDPLRLDPDTAIYFHRTRLNLDTAIAYTGSGVAFSRPIADSFALVKTDGHLRKEVVEINAQEFKPEAVVDGWQPGVISQLQSYVVQRVHVQTQNPEATAMLPKDNFPLRPTRRSGTSLTLKGESSVMLSGQLVAPDGAPDAATTFKYLTGAIVPVGETTDSKNTRYFFTNESGVFFIESVPPGIFRMRLDGYEGELEVKIPDDLFGPYELGTLTFDARKEVK